MSNPQSRRLFLQRSTVGAAGLSALPLAALRGAPPTAAPASASTGRDIRECRSVDLAARHPIVRPQPAANFMEGSILGNGEMGVVVEARPDMVMLHLGHNAVWDQRMTPIDLSKMQTFAFAMEKILAIPTTLNRLDEDAWYKSYLKVGKETYSARKYPRPHCCGSVILSLNRREVEVIGQRVAIERGACIVDLVVAGQPSTLEVFVEAGANRVWARMFDAAGRPTRSPFKLMAILTDGSIPKEFPAPADEADLAGGLLAFRQVLPYVEVKERRDYQAHAHDRAFTVSARLSTPLHRNRELPGGGNIGGWAEASDTPLQLVVQLHQGLSSDVSLESGRAPKFSAGSASTAAKATTQMWSDYWEKSAIALGDELLERTWYWNTYFLRCAVHEKSVSPGLYAICQYPHHDVWWHGDYHMDYNTEQAFWGTFSSNHPELNLPYVGLVEHILPHARKWARDYYQMRGACFPVSFYPIELRGYPYGAPVFNWMMCLSTWTVQGLWWQYLYTKDLDYLRNRGFEPIKAAVQFMIDYIKRPDVQAKDWGDSHVHLWPSFPPEVYLLRPGLPREYNADNLVDLTLLRFVFRAYLQACHDLSIEAGEAQDMRDAQDILDRLPPYPTARSEKTGEVLVSVPAESAEKVYNVPINLMTVFPGEHHGLHSPPADYELAANTARQHLNEGGNDIVFLNLQKARLGLLDLEKFKRQIQYCLMPNGSCTDKNLQSGGRFGFSKTREYDWMATFGIWFENFALPVVINECLLQSYHGELRLFPNWPKEKPAAFRSLRAAGAFLVSAEFRDGQVQWFEVVAEKGGELNVISPWKTGLAWIRGSQGQQQANQGRISLPTQPGDRIRFTAA